MTPHDLPCTVPHGHDTDEERRACEAEHRAIHDRLLNYAA